MKKVLFLLLFLTIGTAIMNAQVNIGKQAPPREGAVLDLSQSDRELGLLLPNVALGDVSVLQVVAGASDTQKTDATGMVVYNTSSSTVGGTGAGLYIWDGAKWRVLAVSGGSMTIAPATVPSVDKDGGNTGEITVTSPGAEGFAGEYTFVMISGSEFAEVHPPASSEGKFSVTFQPNSSAVSRKAVVLVTDPAGNTATFVFSQDGNESLCGTAITVPGIKDATGSTSPGLCRGGAAYLYLDGTIADNEASNYIWTLGGNELGRGKSYVATVAGTYVVYYNATGCGSNSSVNVTYSSSNAPSETIDILVAGNNAQVCDAAGTVTLTAVSSVSDPGSIVWFKDGILDSQTGLSIQAGIGAWYAAVRSADCFTRHSSQTVNVRPSSESGSALPAPAFTFTGNATACKGGSLAVSVTSPDASATYTWYVNNTQVGTGSAVTFRLPDEVNDLAPGATIVIRCRVTKAGSCASESQSTQNLQVSANVPRANIVASNGGVLCNGTTTLSVSNQSSYSVKWFDSATSSTPVSTDNNYEVTTPNATRYAELWDAGGCVGERASYTVKSVSTNPVLSWKATTAAMDKQTPFYFEVQGSYLTSHTTYTWTVNPATYASIQGQGSNPAAITFNSSTPDGYNAIVSVVAHDDCGDSAPLSQTITVGTACQAVTTPTLLTASSLPNEHTNTAFSLRVQLPAGGNTAYTAVWYRKQGSGSFAAIASSNMLTLSQTEGTAGSYQYYCSVWPQCGTEATDGKISPTITVTVTDDPAVITTGSGTFTGKTCFDIANSNAGGTCGELGSRTKYSFVSNSTQVYTFAPQGSVTNVRYDYKNLDSNTPVISSITDNGNNTVTVTFNTNLDNAAKNVTRANALKANLFAIYKVGTTDYKLLLTLSVADCQCCPGVVIPGGVHIGPETKAVPGGTAYTGLAAQGFTRQSNQDLCVYYRDASTTQNWDNANTNCTNGANIDATDVALGGWRLPNIAELGQMASSKGGSWSPKFNALSSAPNADTRTTNIKDANYRSSTAYDGSSGIRWTYRYDTTGWDGLEHLMNVRCVRTTD